MNKLSLVLISLMGLYGCASSPMPDNVETRQQGGKDYIDKVTHEFVMKNKPSFSRVKICVVENVRNDSVDVKDAASSFTGAYTGNVYHIEKGRTEGGGQTVRLVDEDTETIIATGVTDYTKAMIASYLRYDVKIVSSEQENKLRMVFSRIEAAQSNTGYMSNDGFNPIGTWYGTGSGAALEALGAVAQQLNSCISE